MVSTPGVVGGEEPGRVKTVTLKGEEETAERMAGPRLPLT
jgi:hypothetical protein